MRFSFTILAHVIYKVYKVQLSGLDASLLLTWRQCRKPASVTQVAYQHSIRQINLVSQVGSRYILIESFLEFILKEFFVNSMNVITGHTHSVIL